MKKILKFSSTIFCILAMVISCGQNPEEKAKNKVAEDLGIDNSDLENQSYYSLTIQEGTLKGEQFSVPDYVSTYDGFRADESGNVQLTSVTFVDPQQGNSTANISWEGDETKALSANPDANEGTFLEFKFKKDGKNYHFTSINGQTKANSSKDVEVKDEMINHTFTKRDVNMSFSGLFKENISGEEVKIEGIVQFVNSK